MAVGRRLRRSVRGGDGALYEIIGRTELPGRRLTVGRDRGAVHHENDGPAALPLILRSTWGARQRPYSERKSRLLKLSSIRPDGEFLIVTRWRSSISKLNRQTPSISCFRSPIRQARQEEREEGAK